MSIDTCLWHYTDAAGLFGIINTAILRFGHSWYLNDRTERSFGKERVSELISAEMVSAIKMPLLMILKDYWERRPHRGTEYFIASLSETSDSISQWQRYGADGKGYCIGFSREMLLGHLPEPIYIRKMLYHKETQAERFKEFLTWYIDQATQLYVVSPTLSERQVGELRAAYLSGVLDQVLLEFKNFRFEDEHEWRLIREVPDILGNIDPRISFIPRGEFVKPYIDVALTELLPKDRTVGSFIRCIVCGPRLEPELAVSSVERSMAARGYLDIDIRSSELRAVWR